MLEKECAWFISDNLDHYTNWTKFRSEALSLIKASPKRGRKKRGPQKRGEHLLLSVMGFVNKIAPKLAFRAIQLSLLSPSFDMASKTLKQEGINLSADQIRRLVSEIEIRISAPELTGY